jgi:hypothetical protein
MVTPQYFQKNGGLLAVRRCTQFDGEIRSCCIETLRQMQPRANHLSARMVPQFSNGHPADARFSRARQVVSRARQVAFGIGLIELLGWRIFEG